MAAIAATEGRYLGGRPPYGYRLVDGGPHPHPGKAADGKRLFKLDIDPDAAPVVQRIYCEYLGLDGSPEKGLFAIAEGLTRDGIPCPSAHDRARNQHREGLAWAKSAVKTILTNPRYTGHQVWNRQRKDEVLIDVNDVSLGHITKLRWNDRDQWVYSAKVVHPVIIDKNIFDRIEGKLAARRCQTGGTKARARTVARLLAARRHVLRAVRPQDAGPHLQGVRLLPVPLPRGVRAGQQGQAPAQRLRPRTPGHRARRPWLARSWHRTASGRRSPISKALRSRRPTPPQYEPRPRSPTARPNSRATAPRLRPEPTR